MSDRNQTKLVSGGHKGAEAELGRCAKHWGLREDTLSFEGHQMEWSQDVRMLSAEELAKGDVSMEIVSQRLGRSYTNIQQIRRVVQSLFHMVKETYEVYVVGWIQPDNTVQGGTGWGVELAKFFNRPVWAYDQEKKGWFRWAGQAWEPGSPVLPARPFAGTGTRNLSEDGRRAIQALFGRSFGPPTHS